MTTTNVRDELWLLRPWPSPVDMAGAARRHEADGWDGLLLADAQHVGPDPFVMLGVAATATTTLKLGTGVTNPVTRMASVLATAILTVHGVSGGRAVLGIGRGDGALTPLGMRPAPISAFADRLDQLQAYLRGDRVTENGVESRLLPFDTGSLPKVPVDVAATGPKMLHLAALKGDMVSFGVGALPERARRCRDVVRATRSEAGLDGDGVVLSCYLPVVVTGALSRQQARDTIRGSASIFARFSAMEGGVIEGTAPTEERFLSKMADRYRGPGGHPTFNAASVIDDDEFLDRFAVIGTPAECAERLQELLDLGISRLVLFTRSFGTDPDDEIAARVAQEVFPLLRLRR